MTKSLWKPPQLRVTESSEEERHATWLELFYDLVFVVAISQLAHNLNEDVSLSGFLGFVFLFVPIWWSWIGTTLYATRFDSDDLGHRLLTAIQMVAVAAMAVNIHHGLAESSAGFALSYTAVRTVLVLKYLRAIYHIPVARPLTTRYAIGFAIAALIWLVSAFVPIPARFAFWVLGIFIDFATPLSAAKLQVQLPPHASHLPERMGLFTMIVLGESIIAVVTGVAEQKWNVMSAIAGVCGMSIAFSLWWMYFENIGGSAIRISRVTGNMGTFQTWFYAHLPLMIGIAATGVGVEHILSVNPTQAMPDAERWLLCGSVALCLLALALLHLTKVIRYCQYRASHRILGAVLLVVLASSGGGLLPLALITCVAIVCVLQVILELYMASR